MRYKSRASSKGLALLGVTIFSASLGWDYITAHADTTPTADPKAVVKTTNVEPVQTNGQSNQTVLKTGSQPVAPTPESKPAGTPTATESTSKPATTDATQPTTPGVSDTTAKDATQPANGQKVAEPVQPKAAAGTETKPVNQGTNTTQPTTPVTNQNVKSGTAPAVTPDKTDGVETPDNATKNVQPVTTTSLSRPQPLTRSNLKLNRMSLAAVPEAEPVTVPDEADDIASGDFGTHWEINSKGILKIHGGTLADTKGSQRVNNVVQGSPWKDHVADIKGIDVNVDGTVYTGADASYLFSGMDKLGNLDLTKLNTSKTVNMESMLDGLNATSVNVSGWDVSNVTNGDGLFESTSGFTNLDLTSWDVSSFKTMRSMFWGSNLATVNTTGWQPKHVTTMASMFEKSRLNQIIGLEDWDTSSLTSTQEMFYGDKYLTKLDLSHWNVANLTNIYIMVDGSGVQSIDISNWNTPKLTSASSAFENNINMTTFKADNWNAENVTSFEDMLAYNTALKDVGDTGTWNVKSVQNVAAMFFNSKVAKLDLSTWNMDHVTSANAMLNQCQNLWYLKLGPHSTLVGGMLPTVGSSSLYDPKTQHYYSADSSKVWQTLGDGDVHWPKGNQTYTSAQLMALYQDSQPRPQNVETYVWKQQVMQATAGLQNNADNPVVTIKAFDGQPGPAELDPSGYLLAVTTPDNQKISYQLEKGDIRYQSAQLAHPGQYRVELTTQAVQKLQQKFKAYNWNLDTKITGTYTILPKPETINDFHFQFAANKTYDGQIMANPTLTFKTWDGNTINVPTIQDDYRAVQDNKTVGVVRDAGQYDLTFAMSNVIARLKQQLGTQAAYYDFTVNPIGDQTYSTTYTIAKRDLHVDMKEQKEVYARQMFHYNVANVSVTNGVSNDNLSYYKVDDPRMVDAGTYQIGLHFTYPNNLKNYNVVGNTTANLTITPATLNVTIPDDTVTYNGKVQTISKSKVKLGGIYSGDTLAFTVADSAGADVGVYPIKISLVKDDFSKNYQLPADAAGHLTIKQAQLFVKMHSRTVQYDGREQTLLPSDVEVTNSNTNQIVGADEVPYTLSSGRGVGTHDIKITFTDPQTVKNYAITGTDQPGTLTITPAVLTPDFSGVATRVIDYDGKTHTFDGVKLNGVLNNDPISFTVDQTASADAGTYQLGVHLNANAANDNYVLAGGSDYLTIDPVLVNATLANQTVTYNGKQQTLAKSAVSLNGHALDNVIDFETSMSDKTGIGTYTIHLKLDPAKAKNYQLNGDPTGTLTIVPAKLTAVVPDQTLTYNGRTQAIDQDAIQLQGVVNGEDVTYTLAARDNDTTNVGQHALALTLADTEVNHNYTLTNPRTGTLTINKAKLAVNLADETVTYNGELQTLATDHVTFLNPVDDKTIGYKLTKSTKTGVGDYTIQISLDPASQKNYELDPVNSKATATLTITPVKLQARMDDATVTYNGQSQTLPQTAVRITGAINNEKILYDLSRSDAGVGDHPITLSLAKNEINQNYVLAGQTQSTLTIEKARLTVTMKDRTVSYNGLRQGLTAGDVVVQDQNNQLFTAYTLTKSNSADAGTYTVKLNFNDSDANYEVDGPTTAKLTITPITLKVAMVDQQTVYTGQQQTFDRNQIVVSGAVAGETPVYTLTNSDSADAGHYQIHLTLDPTAKVNKNYRLSDDDQQSLSGDLWIQKAAMTVIMNGSTVTYNGQQQTLQPSDVQILGAVNPQDARYTLTTSTSKDVGAYQIKLTFDNADLANNYTITGNQSATLKITPAELTARMLAQTATYNGERQTLDRGQIHILGNVPTEHVKYNLTTSDSADVGDHLISLTLDPTEKNYYLSPTSAVLTITPAEVTVYLNDASAVYNGKQQTLAAKDVTITGLLANVDSTYHLTKTAKAGVGQYQISLNFDNPNYQVTGKATAQLTITQAPLTVTLPKAQERTYNGQLQVLDPADVHILGSVAGEAIAYTGGSTAQAGVGHYDVAVQLAKNDINANYVLTGPTSTTIDVLPAPLTIKMQGQSVVYNGRQRTLEADHVQVDGLQGSDGGAYSLSKSAAGVGRYQINLTFNDPAMMKNYTITGPTSAPLTITAAPLTVALTDQTVTYNGQQQTLSGDAVQVTGAVNGEQIRYALNKSSDAKVGQYQINLILADNGVNGNYQLTPESKLNALLNIKKAKLSVRLRNATVNYNGHEQSLPASAVEITGNVPGEQIQYRLTTSQSANTGQYQISFSLLNNSVNQNYEVATAGTATARTARRARMNAESLVLIPTQGPSATLTIKPAEISVKLRDAQKPYDGQTQTLDPRDVIISGLLNGDQLDYRLTQSAGKTAGQYQIHFELTDALMNRNYVLAADSQQPSATLTITKAKLVVIKMANDTVVYNGQRQTLKPSDVQLQGLVNGDQLNYQLTKSADAKVGQYVIRLVLPTDGSGQNYEFENNPSALLTIIPADATIQVHNALAWYDGQEHQPTVSVTGLVNDDQLGYALSAGQTDVGTRQVNAKLDTANATNQNYHVKLIPGTVTVGRVAVHYLDEQGRTLAPATTASHDAQLNYTTQPLTIQGYDVVAEPTGLPANGRLTGVGGTVSYHYQAKTVRARVTYLDATAKTVLAHQDLTGKYGSLSAYRPTVAAYQQQGYVLETSNYPGDGNVFTDLTGTANYVVALSHQLVVVTPATPGQPGQPVAVYPQVNYPAGTGADALTRTITQRVHYVDQNGQPLAADHVATMKFNRTATVDLVTKKVTYTDWLAVNGDQFNAVTTPTIKGYQAVQNQSQVVRVTPDSADNVQTVVYQLVQTDTGSHGNGGTNTGSDNNNHGNGDTTTGPDSDAHGNSGATTGSDTGNPDNDGANTESGTGNHGNGGTTTGTDTGNHDNGGMNTGSGSSNHGNGGTNTGTHPDSQDHHGATAGAHGNGSTGTSSNTGNHHNGEMPTGSQTGSHGNGKVDNQQHGGATTMKQQGLLTKPQVLPGTAAVIDQPTTTQPAPKSAATGKLPRTDEQEKQAASVLGWLVMSLSLLGLGAKKRDARKRKN